MLINPLLAHL